MKIEIPQYQQQQLQSVVEHTVADIYCKTEQTCTYIIGVEDGGGFAPHAPHHEGTHGAVQPRSPSIAHSRGECVH
jgi:hypothetical protein